MDFLSSAPRPACFHKQGTVNRPTGFTLIEILVSTAVMAVIMGMILTITSGVLDIWNRAAGSVEASRGARLLLSYVESDLDGLRFDAPGEILNYEVETIGTGAFALQNQARLIVMTSAADAPDTHFDGTDASGDICAVAYESNLRNIFSTVDESRNIGVFRGLADPKTTFSGDAGNVSFNGFIGQSDFVSNITLRTLWDDYINITADDSITLSPAIYSTQLRRNLIAPNIIDFRICFFVEDEDGNVEALSSGGAGGAVTTDTVSVYNDTLYINGVADSGQLAYMDVSFTVLSNEGMAIYFRHLDGVENTFDNVEEIKYAYGETFTRRIALIATR